MREVRLKAWAKVNLALEVLGRREDGYHEVRSILQAIDLADNVTLSVAGGLSLEAGPDHPVSQEEDLAMRAARALQRATGCTMGAHIRLAKGIPDAAGLGGGSSDAAATLVGLNRLWGLGRAPEELESLAASLGSDVPFFVRGGTALVTGRGERLTPLASIPQQWVVLLVPPHSVRAHGGRRKTGLLYSLLGPEHYTDGMRTDRLAQALPLGDLPEDLLWNIFEAVADQAFPGLSDYRNAMHAAGASRVHMTGSGPAFFGLFTKQEEAAQVHAEVKRRGYTCYLAQTVEPRSVDEFQ